MRALTADEIKLVAGGTETITVTGTRDDGGYDDFQMFLDLIDEDLNQNAQPGDSGTPTGDDEEPLPEIVVSTNAMTPQERIAYDAAEARARASLLTMEFLGAMGLTTLGAWNRYVAGAAGFVAGAIYTDEERQEILNRMIDIELTLDEIDGNLDGVVSYPPTLGY